MGEIAINPIHNVHKKYRQMNLVNPYIFALPVDLTTNTEIGGVASTISTPALLATKLGIDVSRIRNFTIVGSDIKCRITGSYIIPSRCFIGDANITYYKDLDNLVTDLGTSCFQNSSKIKIIDFKGIITLTGNNLFASSGVEEVYLENCTSVANSAFSSATSFVVVYYLPRCIGMGSSALDNSVFNSNNIFPCKVYVPISLQTNNGGNPDGDLTFISARKGIIRYVSNFTTPSAISDLVVNTIYSNSFKMTWSVPSSTNSVDYYELYVDGILNNISSTNTAFALNLTYLSSYNISVISVDVFGNKSIISNVVTQIANGVAKTYPAVLEDGNTFSLYSYEDLTSITKDGSDLVSQWNDRLGSGHNLLQATSANKPLWVSGNGILFDGINDFLKTNSFTLNQPTNVYILLKQVSWSVDRRVFDGYNGLSMLLYQQGVSPRLVTYANAYGIGTNEFAIGNYEIGDFLYNGSNSGFRINNGSFRLENLGSTTTNGFTIGSQSNGGQPSNIQVKEIIIRSTVDNKYIKQCIYNYINSKR